MSPADIRAQFVPRLAAMVALLGIASACEAPAAPKCPQLSAALLQADASPADEVSQRVDAAVTAARGTCRELARALGSSGTIASQLARARIADETPVEALAALTSLLHPAIALRRSQLLDRIGHTSEAAAALAPALAVDPQALARHALLAVSASAKANDPAGVLRTLLAAPIADRPRLAHRAVADAREELLDALSRSHAELATAAADRLEQSRGPAAARAARESAASLEPDIADHWDALGRARIAAGATDDALIAWDRAIALAPAQPAFRIAPVQALVIAGDQARAVQRVRDLAQHARSSRDVELVVTASNAAAVASERGLGVELARLAASLRPGDGRLVFLLGQRIAESGDTRAAAAVFTELLVCGAHGRAWHRHEVAARLVALHDAVIIRAALAANRSCETVEREDLESYVATVSRTVPVP